MEIVVSSKAQRQLASLPLNVARRIVKKLRWFAAQQNPLSFAERLQGKAEGLFRFRIGDYRVVFDVVGDRLQIIFVLTIKHRKEAYRGM